MTLLSPRDRELVAIGAAMGSNCVPCIEYHIPKARQAGLGDAEIAAVIRLADAVRQVPARKVLETALGMLAHGPSSDVAARNECACGATGQSEASAAVAKGTPGH